MNYPRFLMRFILACALLIGANCSFGESAETSKETNWWLDLGIAGWVDGESTEGWSGASGFTLENDLGLFTLRNANYIYRQEGLIKSVISCTLSAAFFGSCDDENVLKVKEWALLYGRTYSGGRLAFSAGLSRVKGENSINTTSNYLVVGLPLELYWRPVEGKHFGLAFMARANFNKEDSFAGVYLLLPVGKLK